MYYRYKFFKQTTDGVDLNKKKIFLARQNDAVSVNSRGGGDLVWYNLWLDYTNRNEYLLQRLFLNIVTIRFCKFLDCMCFHIHVTVQPPTLGEQPKRRSYFSRARAFERGAQVF